MTVAELATLGTVAGVGFAMFLAAIGAAVGFGRLTQWVAQVESRLDGIEAVLHELRADVQQTNRILVGLANHRHDTDGNTVFTVPQG
jgi:hypothetical protein